MYLAIIVVLGGLGLYLINRGRRRRKVGTLAAGIALLIATYLFFEMLDFWGELLWFDALGYSDRFWTLVLSRVGFAAAAALLGGLVLFLLTLQLPRGKKMVTRLSRLGGFLVGVWWGYANWDTLLLFFNQVPAGVRDPILDKDAAFYLFTLPFLDALCGLFYFLSLLAVVSAGFSALLQIQEKTVKLRSGYDRWDADAYPSLFISAALFIIVLAADKYLNRFHLLYSQWGAVTGPGWTDVHVRMPAYLIAALLTALVGILVLVPQIRERVHHPLKEILPARPLTVLGGAGAVIAVVWAVALGLIPSLFQWLQVEPNEITLEKPYIEHNIRFTRLGFDLQKVEEKEFPVTDRFTREMVEKNPQIFSNIRLWDWRALDSVFKQFQEIRLYYEFKDVDIDRYTLKGDYREVMVSARELEQRNLPEGSRTFVNRRFKYTHGYGLTLTDVREFTEQGLPHLLVKNIPPETQFPSLELERPQIYYGELTDSHVIVNSKEAEFDYPRGETNEYIHYPGSGGVRMGNLWRKFLFGWKFDGTRLFLSDYPRENSRIMFHRRVRQRVQRLAPFLRFEDDPYIVLANGRLYWIIDAYTTSKDFPYSEPFSPEEFLLAGNTRNSVVVPERSEFDMGGINYIRNSVKAVVDAFDGSVDFYVFENEGPLIQTWEKVFPGLFKDRSEMPAPLEDHIRYPATMLLVQGLVYAKYHMTDPSVFYNQEDLWIRATEKYYDRVQPVEPYYILWEPPESDRAEFILMLPFTPKNRQVLIGWIAGMCDPQHYGRFLAYKFPKEKRVLGPQQVETKIDQDSYLSGQLTLWNQQGSNVIRGNVLAIPLEKTLFYVEPIYLQAETAAYPELRLVALMHNDNLAYAETFEAALEKLLGQRPSEAAPGREAEGLPRVDLEKTVRQANTAFENYLKHLGGKEFGKAAGALSDLQQSLERLEELSGDGGKAE